MLPRPQGLNPDPPGATGTGQYGDLRRPRLQHDRRRRCLRLQRRASHQRQPERRLRQRVRRRLRPALRAPLHSWFLYREHCVVDPLAAMVPPPRYRLVRLHGVLGPRHGWRARVWSLGPRNRMQDAGKRRARRRRRAGRRRLAWTRWLSSSKEPLSCRAVSFCHRRRRGALVAPNILSIAHWNRLLGGELYSSTPRVLAWIGPPSCAEPSTST